jgi:secreted trypsin-like serine protease
LTSFLLFFRFGCLESLRASLSPSFVKNHAPTQIFDTRIIGGTDAPEGRYPYMVALLKGDGQLECGGSLVAPDVVITAAHCQ